LWPIEICLSPTGLNHFYKILKYSKSIGLNKNQTTFAETFCLTTVFFFFVFVFVFVFFTNPHGHVKALGTVMSGHAVQPFPLCEEGKDSVGISRIGAQPQDELGRRRFSASKLLALY